MDEMRHNAAQNCGERRGPQRVAGTNHFLLKGIFKSAPRSPLLGMQILDSRLLASRNFYVAACAQIHREHLGPIG